ncbi:SCO2521 family protein [Nocardia arthritidis]|uniref:Uncharacterized protein n=1 Tax=Nocardia arthritidis TaxID=228602 RepID=A0A6G9Y6A1_9NOCA|nr:SCO2521 family protein [Nocardia arthritidis]QIS08719.1 hypothetical protein F5544_04025 [Nocardia arthritidis]
MAAAARNAAETPKPAATPVAAFGEIHTCVLPSSNVLDNSAVLELLGTVKPGAAMTSRERPVPLVISPNRVEGIDCDLTQSSGKVVHAIGTVLARVVVVGGRVLQSSAQTRVAPAAERTRQPWSHYMGRPGTIEAVTKLGADAGARLTDGYLRTDNPDRPDPAVVNSRLDLAAIGWRLLKLIRVDDRLDQQVRLRAATTRLRWAVEVAAEPEQRPRFGFRLDNETLRSVRLIVAEEDIAAAQRFCEDLAVHDWLLTTIGQVADRFDPANHEAATLLAPVLEQLVPLWMPGAHTPPRLREAWADLESDPGFTRQWTARVGQLRDRIATATLEALRNSRISNDW